MMTKNTEPTITKENLDEALIMLRRVLDEEKEEPPKSLITINSTWAEILEKCRELNQRITDLEKKRYKQEAKEKHLPEYYVQPKE